MFKQLWKDEPKRLAGEIKQAVIDAGGSPSAYDWNLLGQALFACQSNNITINRNPETQQYHVYYNKPPQQESSNDR